MFNITIISIGKLKEKYYIAITSEYLKRLKPYAKINFIEIPQYKFNIFSKIKAKIEENKKIVNYLNNFKNSEIFILDSRGIKYNSLNFSKTLNSINNHIIFVIGGPLGLNDEILRKGYKIISFSDMTFPHELIKIILLEQIYRSVTIINNKNYHY